MMCKGFLGGICRERRVAVARGVVFVVAMATAIVAAESLVSCAARTEWRVYRFAVRLFRGSFRRLGWECVVFVVG